MDPTLNGSASRKEESDQAMTHSETVPNDAFVYRHDVIRCSKYKDLLGVVIEVAGDSDSEESASDDSDSEDDQYNNGGLNADTVNGDEENSKFDDDDDGGDDADLQDGQARVVWVNGSATKEKVGEVTVVDRSFFHGDIVASVSDPTGQLGLVLDVKIMVDLQAPNGEVIKGISSKDLKRVREFSIGDYVVCGPWLGRVDDVFDNLTILFDDGAVCKVTKVDPVRLSPISRPVVDEEDCPYHPGQRVRAVSSSVFKSARWFSGSWKANRLEGTVVKVQTASLMIYWIASAYNGIGTNSSTAPPEEQKPKDLTILHCFSHANWQLCDWCIFPSLSDTDGTLRSSSLKTTVKDSRTRTSDFKDCSIVDNRNGETKCGASSGQDVDSLEVEDEGQPSQRQNRRAVTIGTPHKNVELGDNGSSVSKDTAHESGATYRKKLRKVCFKRDKKARKKDDDIEIAFFIVNTVTSVDVAWQDGTKQYKLDSKSLLPIQSPSDHEFFPEQYVVEKVSSEDDDSSETKRVGIVRSVNAKDRTVCVRWLKPVSRPEDLRVFDREEVVSAYELDMHPDYDYCYGDVVVRLPPVMTIVGHGEQSDQEDIDVQASQEHLNDYQTQLSPKEEDCADFKSLTWVGNITGLQDGDIEVTWADGTVSKVGPQAVFVVGRDDEDSFDGGSEVSDAVASWETVDGSDTEILLLAEKIDREGFEDTPGTEGTDTIAIEDSNSGHGGPFSVPRAALGFMTKLATGLFSLGRRQTDVDHMDGSESGSQENSEDLDSTQDGLHSADDNHAAVTSVNGMLHTDKDDGCSFKHFDLAENPVEHYFLNSQTTGDRKWMKKVQQEWSILEKNLPDAIYVRGFEHRFDLLRAVIVGACGTPYQDGLFFFDFYLPPEYPQVPPMAGAHLSEAQRVIFGGSEHLTIQSATAYYHSGGLRINPNLYVDGKVCLSLLNTWTGRGNEVWDPSSSSILQVLVSLQGLVLNSKPYFNEAGYEKQVGTIEGEKNSLPYNENTYLLNLKSMMYLLRRPPTHFEGFVKDHFARRGYYILKACNAYMNGCAIGSLTKDASTTEKSKDQVCSVGFKLMLAKILPRLIVALSEIGVDCKDFEKYNS